MSLVLLLQNCGDKTKTPDPKPSFDEKEMLTNLSTNIIISAYEALNNDVQSMEEKINAFTNDVNTENLKCARDAWYTAALSWQNVSIYEIGKANDLALRQNINLFPVDTSLINANIKNGIYNLESVSNYTAKGFQSIDYLLYGIANTDNELLELYKTDNLASNRTKYLNDITKNISLKINEVNTSWSNYKDDFNSNTGTDVGSSIGLLVNELNLYYERYVRDGKLGIPAGARTFSQTPLPEKSENFYSKRNSRALLIESLKSLKTTYSGNTGLGFDDYLNHLDAKYGDESLNSKINKQFETIETKVSELNESIAEETIANQPKLLDIFNDMQFLNNLLKVEMTNSLEVQINYADTDGD